MRLRADSARLRAGLRHQELHTIFGTLPDALFERALELGAGDGAQSRILVRWTSALVSTDIDQERLEPQHHPGIAYGICDAEDLPYRTGTFDLIFSSNLLEHLPDPAGAVSEMSRVLCDDGIMVHTMPNRFWKFLHLALFYPSQALLLIERLTMNLDTAGSKTGKGNNPKTGHPRFLRRNLWPPVHGTSPNNIVEWVRFGRTYWERVFRDAEFDVVKVENRLPVHSPYRFGFNRIRRRLERLGFTSYNGYVLRKSGHGSPHVRWFTGT